MVYFISFIMQAISVIYCSICIICLDYLTDSAVYQCHGYVSEGRTI